MSGRFDSPVVLVTGGAQGLGFAYARRFLAEGARVVIADIVDSTEALGRLNADNRAHAVRVDVASAASTPAMAAEAERRFGQLDVLVNNGAVFATLRPQPFDAIPEEELLAQA